MRSDGSSPGINGVELVLSAIRLVTFRYDKQQPAAVVRRHATETYARRALPVSSPSAGRYIQALDGAFAELPCEGFKRRRYIQMACVSPLRRSAICP